jgi:uncharacterized protein YraI
MLNSKLRIPARACAPKMSRVKAAGWLIAALAAMPAPASAQQLAYTAKFANLRAGPARDYPIVATLPAGIAISVLGCLSGYRWCDVVAGPNRGWLYAGNIVYPYQGSNVPLLTYGALLGIGIIGFDLGYYWDHHYRARPWYPQRQHWIARQRSYYGHRGGPPQAVPRFDGDARRHPPERFVPGPGHPPRGDLRPLPGRGPGVREHPRQGQGHDRNRNAPPAHDSNRHQRGADAAEPARP